SARARPARSAGRRSCTGTRARSGCSGRGGARSRRAMPAPTLSLRALNRATLARQMLLARAKATPAQAIERLAGLQAQLARPPYLGLWSRVAGFTRDKLTRAIHAPDVVRPTLIPPTPHLPTPP